MTIVYAKHEPWDHRIGKVVEDMRRLGPPTLRAVHYHHFFALEGSHRLAAAHYLGLSPRLLIEPFDVSDDALRGFWARVRLRLPSYEFPGLTAHPFFK